MRPNTRWMSVSRPNAGARPRLASHSLKREAKEYMRATDTSVAVERAEDSDEVVVELDSGERLSAERLLVATAPHGIWSVWATRVGLRDDI